MDEKGAVTKAISSFVLLSNINQVTTEWHNNINFEC